MINYLQLIFDTKNGDIFCQRIFPSVVESVLFSNGGGHTDGRGCRGCREVGKQTGIIANLWLIHIQSFNPQYN